MSGYIPSLIADFSIFPRRKSILYGIETLVHNHRSGADNVTRSVIDGSYRTEINVVVGLRKRSQLLSVVCRNSE